MAKSGRYSADRKKIENLTAAKTVQVADCGTIFMVTDPGSSGYSVTLPTASQAGPGWWCKFVVNCAAGSTLSNGGGEDVIIAPGEGTGTDTVVTNIDINSSLASDDAADTVAFDNTATKGTHLTWYSDGVLWYVEGQGGAGMILVAS